jgi:hypothetical protein
LLQLIKIQKYSCGLKFGPAATLSQNPIFEMLLTLNRNAQSAQRVAPCEVRTKHETPNTKHKI